MIKFSHNYSTSFKIKNKIAIGYFRCDNFLEIWYRGIKCEIPVNCNFKVKNNENGYIK